jgi:hypothetical protein
MEHARRRQRRSGASWALFALLALLTFLLLFTAASALQRPPAALTPTLPLLVPAVARVDAANWLQNGSFLELEQSAQGAIPRGWQPFVLTSGWAHFEAGPGPHLSLRCPPEPCIAGLRQRVADLPPGHYRLEADFFLEESPPGGLLQARLGVDPYGGLEPDSDDLIWSSPVRGPGWQKAALEWNHSGGPATAFLIFDRLASGGECRAAGARLLGPPPPTPTPSPAPALSQVEARILRISSADWEAGGAGRLEELIELGAAAHFNAIYLQVRSHGYAYYTPGVEPASPTLLLEGGALSFDPLALALEKAHAAGLALYASVELLPAWGTSDPPEHTVPEHMYNLFFARFGADWLQWVGSGPAPGPDGLYYASPAWPQVQEYLAAICQDLVARYPVDGLHLFGARYASPEHSAGALEQDQAAGLGEPAAVARWRQEQLQVMLERVIEAARRSRPELQLAFGGAGEPPELFCSLALHGRPATVLVPLEDGLSLEQALQAAQQACPGRILVVASSAQGSSPSELSALVEASRLAGAAGVALAGAAECAESGACLQLSLGPYAQPAALPPAPAG